MKYIKATLVIGALSTLGPFSVDTYFPSFPALAAHFGVSEIRMQTTLSCYLVALAVMNLFHGAVSDSFGRLRVILITLAVYSASALACALAPGFGWLVGLRVVQGLAAGAGMIVSRAIIRDLFDGPEAQALMAQAAMLGAVGPVIAPILGGFLHTWFGWRGPFFFMALLGITLGAACRWGLPESLPLHLRQPFRVGHLLRGYREALGHRPFLLSCLALACGAGGFLLYVATAPDVVLNILHLSERQFGWMFVPIVTGLMLGSILCARLAGRLAPARQVRWAFVLMGAGAAINLAVNCWLESRVPWAVLPLGLYTLGFSLIAPILSLDGIEMLPHRKGLASSLQGFIGVLVFAGIAGWGAQLVYRSGLKHAVGQAAFLVLCWLGYNGYKSRRTDTVPADPAVDAPGRG
ncbi:MAG TPA: multidrug effflux MFS transporter [Verrucomicrobia bacterium]|nr:multidrug effflux MFS transporter [Verrucomicrobiota bacterium]HOP98346.1 multidrug effflux MFS transporter [Verrucomicrobiota bacterium]HPU56101.1 multidrug effflux MFS transporter [Verrucomicrobiota bacterium]